MGYIKDTCVFINNINNAEEILEVARHCKNNGKLFCTTDIVMDELKPGKRLTDEQKELSESIINALDFGCKSKIIHIMDVKREQNYKKNFDEIRARYYGHLKDIKSIREEIKKGNITEEQVRNKSYMYKDYGECSCIAVAIEDPTKYIIISNDKGRIFMRESINLFEKFSISHGIVVMNYEEWTATTKYNSLAKDA